MFVPLLFIICGVAASNSEDLLFKNAGISREYQLPCSSVGGTCKLQEECPHYRQASEKGLCPINDGQQLECCYSEHNARIATLCASKGGECVPVTNKCPEYLTFSTATDCEADEKCCIYVRK